MKDLPLYTDRKLPQINGFSKRTRRAPGTLFERGPNTNRTWIIRKHCCLRWYSLTGARAQKKKQYLICASFCRWFCMLSPTKPLKLSECHFIISYPLVWSLSDISDLSQARTRRFPLPFFYKALNKVFLFSQLTCTVFEKQKYMESAN